MSHPNQHDDHYFDSSGSNNGAPLRPPRPSFFLGERNREDAPSVTSGDDPLSPSRHNHSPSDPFATPDAIPDSVRSFSSQNIGLGLGNGNTVGGYPFPEVSRPPGFNSTATGVQTTATTPGTPSGRQLIADFAPQSGSSPSSPMNGSFDQGHGHNPMSPSSVMFRDSLASPPPRVISTFTSRTPSGVGSPNISQRGLTRKITVKRAKSTALLDLDRNPLEKPWLKKRDARATMSWWLTVFFMLLGAVGGALMCVFGVRDLKFVGNVCLVLDENFSEGLDENIWLREVEMGGFGNNQFDMTTNSDNNSFVEDGVLYIAPTLTSDVIGNENVFDGYTFNITGCTSMNLTACGAVSNMTTKSVINPVMSARLTTKNSHSIQYGRVEVRAKLPRGDWIWPAIWMLPVNETYGPWPMSGEIDIMESRGNGPDYPKQGVNYVRASLNWGPVDFINSVAKTFGWWMHRRQNFSDKFHTYAMEWDQDFIRIYVDSRLHQLVDIRFNMPFFDRGDYPPTVFNGTQQIVLRDPWINSETRNAAPFDRPFYLIMDVGVGGTNGWFPDGAGGKPWLDGSAAAMYDFARGQEEWYSTWPEDIRDRAMAVESVKMWQKC